MAGYDSPGWVDRTPGGPVNTQAFTGAGSSPPEPPDTSGALGDRVQRGTVGNSAVISVPGASLANADIVTVGPRDTLIPSEAQSYGGGPDPLTGIGAELGQTGAGAGSAGHFAHPNSMNRPGA
jgi:hypothetical protein